MSTLRNAANAIRSDLDSFASGLSGAAMSGRNKVYATAGGYGVTGTMVADRPLYVAASIAADLTNGAAYVDSAGAVSWHGENAILQMPGAFA